ncbi:MAG TPA: hypothetical protein VGJ74_07265 [Burkholderiales bacterium]|jgi:hypothetical protein
MIEQVLRRWDPKGDAHAPGILGKLQAGASIEELARHLHGLTTAQMGLKGNMERDRLFATELVSWWVDRSGAI